MIFDSYNESSTVSLDAIKESPYPLGYEGALMHVYENELNYYSLMKAVGLSEMKYYQETGGSLFVHEAGAFGSFIEKVKAFFKKVIEKIKSIFKKFIAAIDQYTLENKKFVKKYGQEIMRKNLTDFEFEGYKFKELETNGDKFTQKAEYVQKLVEGMEDAHDKIAQGYTGHNQTSTTRRGKTLNISYNQIKNDNKQKVYLKQNYGATDSDFADQASFDAFKQRIVLGTTTTTNDPSYSQYYAASDNKISDLPVNIDGVVFSESMTTDEKTKAHEQLRGKLIGDSKGLDTDDFRDRLQELFYGDGKDGDKTTLENINMRTQLNYIDDSKTTIKKVEKNQKDITKHIDNALKKLDKLPNEMRKNFGDSNYNGVVKGEQQNLINLINNILDGARSASNDITVGFGVLVQAYKDRVTQAKAICVKALSYKHESAMVSESYSDYDSDDIFSGVNII